MKRLGFVATFVGLLCIVVTTACSKALTRPAAAKLIITQQRLPRAQTIVIAERYLKRSWNKPVSGFGTVTLCIRDDAQYSDEEKRLTYYQSQGMLTIGFVRIEGNCPAIYAEVKLTDGGKRHLVAARDGTYEVRAFNLALGDVTGIRSQEQLKTATAEYTLQLADITPFGGNLLSGPLRATATFALFDDGWRIEAADLVSAPIRYQDPPDTASLQEARRAIAAAETAEEESHQRQEARGARAHAGAEELARRQAESDRVIAAAPKSGSKSPFVGIWRLVEHCDDCMKAEEAFRVTEMNSGLFKVEKGFFNLQGRPTFNSQFASAPLLLPLIGGRLVGFSNEYGGNSVKLELGADGELTYTLGDFLPKKGPRVP